MSEGNGNGHGNWRMWVIGLLGTGLLTGSGALVRAVIVDANLITTIETNQEHQQKQSDRIEARQIEQGKALERMEQYLREDWSEKLRQRDKGEKKS